jgi:transposase
MAPTRVYFRPTTVAQRRLLFEVYQQTGDRHLACAKAHVCERTFYVWKPRFEAEGVAGLEARSHAAHQPAAISPAIAAQVIALRQAHPAWGKLRIAQEVAKAHDWQPVVAPNTVRRILRDAGLWTAPSIEEGAEKGGPAPR